MNEPKKMKYNADNINDVLFQMKKYNEKSKLLDRISTA